ncbi:hypothetical protein CL634_11230 [bacterium]|nr:hypothetical protein [bacterium]
MKNKDSEYIPKLEKAIAQKYGAEAIDNPRKFWTEKKEEEYVQQSKLLAQKIRKNETQGEKIELDGFLINKKLLSKDTNRICTVCKNYSFDMRDRLYMNKFSTCRMCYVQWIDGREKRWKNGWRPNKEE